MTGKIKKFKIAVFLIVAAVFLNSCVSNPVTGKKQLMLFSESDELRMGQQTDQEIRLQFGIYDHPELNDYVKRIGQLIAAHSHRANLKHHFAVLDTPVVNAFAAPGGYIYLTRGIMAFISSEAELAAIIGHEIGHVAARHSMKKLSDALLLNLGIVFGSIVSKDFAKVAGLAGLGANLLLLKYSRDDEYQADELGIVYCRKAGYNPQEVIAFFRKLQKMEKLEGGVRIPNFLSTHPLSSKRIERCYQLLQESDNKLAINTPAYMQVINGIVFGTNPRYGFIRDNVFYHPEWQLQLPLESEWNLEANSIAFFLFSSDQKALLIGQKENEPSIEAVQQKKLSQFNQAKVLNQRDFTFSRLSFRQVAFSWIDQESKTTNYSFLSIAHNYNNLISLTALQSSDGHYERVLKRMTSSISRLSDPAILNIQPARLKIIYGNDRDSLEQIFRNISVAPQDFQHLALLNNIALSSIPEREKPLKVVIKN